MRYLIDDPTDWSSVVVPSNGDTTRKAGTATSPVMEVPFQTVADRAANLRATLAPGQAGPAFIMSGAMGMHNVATQNAARALQPAEGEYILIRRNGIYRFHMQPAAAYVDNPPWTLLTFDGRGAWVHTLAQLVDAAPGLIAHGAIVDKQYSAVAGARHAMVGTNLNGWLNYWGSTGFGTGVDIMMVNFGALKAGDTLVIDANWEMRAVFGAAADSVLSELVYYDASLPGTSTIYYEIPGSVRQYDQTLPGYSTDINNPLNGTNPINPYVPMRAGAMGEIFCQVATKFALPFDATMPTVQLRAQLRAQSGAVNGGSSLKLFAPAALRVQAVR